MGPPVTPGGKLSPVTKPGGTVTAPCVGSGTRVLSGTGVPQRGTLQHVGSLGSGSNVQEGSKFSYSGHLKQREVLFGSALNGNL